MNYKQYMLGLSSGNTIPLTTNRGYSYIGENIDIQALLNLIEGSMITPRYRFFFVNEDDTIQAPLPLEDILQGGNFSENYQNGQRCSMSITLFNQSGKYTPTINKLWTGTKIRFDAGVEQEDETIVWGQKGIFVVTSAQPSYSPDSRTVSISLGDKFARLEGSTGVLSQTYEIPAGSIIFYAVKELLSMQMGNGSPLDSQEPYFHPSLINKVTQAKITKSAGETVGSLILELANHLSAEVFYNAQGRLCFYPLNIVSDDNDKPILYNYLTNKGDLTDLNFSLDYSSIINKIILIGATVNGGVVKAEAVNDDPASPLSVQRIGNRISVVNDSNIKTKLVAEENARYQLRKQLILKSSVNLTVPYTPLFSVNNLIMVTDDFYNLVKQYFLIQSLSFNLDYSPFMSLTVSNLSNLPFISSYKSGEEILEADEQTVKNYYDVQVSWSNTSWRGPNLITNKGINYVYITPNSGYRLPYYSNELSSVSVSNANFEYNVSGMISLFNPSGDVTITGQCYTWYNLSYSITHGNMSTTGGSSLSRVQLSGGNSYRITPSSGYKVPLFISVTNAAYTYTVGEDLSYADLVITNPVGTVNVSVACVSPYSVTIVGTAGVGGWPSSHVQVYDGIYLGVYDNYQGQVEGDGDYLTTTSNSHFVSVVAHDSFLAVASYDYGRATIYSSGYGPEDEAYIIFSLTGNEAITIEASSTVAPSYSVTMWGQEGPGGAWPYYGLKICEGNYFNTGDDTVVISTIDYSGSSTSFSVHAGQISVIGRLDDLLLTLPAGIQGGLEVVAEGEVYSGAGYCLVFNVRGTGETAIMTSVAYNVSVSIAFHDTYPRSEWPSEGIIVYDGDYYNSGGDYAELGVITTPNAIFNATVTRGIVTLRLHTGLNYTPQLVVGSSSGDISYDGDGAIINPDHTEERYLIYGVEGAGSISADAYKVEKVAHTVRVFGTLSSTIVWNPMNVVDGDYLSSGLVYTIEDPEDYIDIVCQSGYITVFVVADLPPTYTVNSGQILFDSQGTAGGEYYLTFLVNTDGRVTIYE